MIITPPLFLLSVKALVIGSGRIGKAILYDLLKNSAVSTVGVIDSRPGYYQELTPLLALPPGKALGIYAPSSCLTEVIRAHDIVISAAPLSATLDLMKATLESRRHFCDLGSSEDTEQQQYALHKAVKAAGLTVIPSCGIAPGLVNALVGAGMRELDSAHSAEILVGGLPQHPQPPLGYSLVFSPYGLIQEYAGETEILREGALVSVHALEGLETVTFNGRPYEAFYTAYGSLQTSLEGLLENFHEKTVRYPGHCEQARFLKSLGLFEKTSLPKAATIAEATQQLLTARIEEGQSDLLRSLGLFDETPLPEQLSTWEDLAAHAFATHLPQGGHDLLLGRVLVKGIKKGQPLEVLYEIEDYATDGLTAMQRTTGFTASILAQMILRGDITERGVLSLNEGYIPVDRLLEEVQRRGIRVRKTLLSSEK